MIAPASGHERLDKPPVLLADIAVEDGPDMVTAEGSAIFDQQNGYVRPPIRHGKSGKAAGKAAARDDQTRLGGAHDETWPKGQLVRLAEDS